jgi:hypothetical protein
MLKRNKPTIVVSSLKVMEDIVERNPNLNWDGWDVEFSSKRRTNFMNSKAVFRNGRWKHVDRYSVGEDGWTIPEALV